MDLERTGPTEGFTAMSARVRLLFSVGSDVDVQIPNDKRKSTNNLNTNNNILHHIFYQQISKLLFFFQLTGPE